MPETTDEAEVVARLVAAIATVVVFALAARWTFGRVACAQGRLEVRFPGAVPHDHSSAGPG